MYKYLCQAEFMATLTPHPTSPSCVIHTSFSIIYPGELVWTLPKSLLNPSDRSIYGYISMDRSIDIWVQRYLSMDHISSAPAYSGHACQTLEFWQELPCCFPTHRSLPYHIQCPHPARSRMHILHNRPVPFLYQTSFNLAHFQPLYSTLSTYPPLL